MRSKLVRRSLLRIALWASFAEDDVRAQTESVAAGAA